MPTDPLVVPIEVYRAARRLIYDLETQVHQQQAELERLRELALSLSSDLAATEAELISAEEGQ